MDLEDQDQKQSTTQPVSSQYLFHAHIEIWNPLL